MPGLEWVDVTLSKFKIIWTHGGNQSWSADRCCIFREWSKETGKYRPGVDEEDNTKFKDRLRNALNKAKNIKQLKNEHSSGNTAEPYRVYQFMAVAREDSVPSASDDGGSPEQLSPASDGSEEADSEWQIPLMVEEMDAQHVTVEVNNNNINNFPGPAADGDGTVDEQMMEFDDFDFLQNFYGTENGELQQVFEFIRSHSAGNTEIANDGVDLNGSGMVVPDGLTNWMDDDFDVTDFANPASLVYHDYCMSSVALTSFPATSTYQQLQPVIPATMQMHEEFDFSALQPFDIRRPFV